MHTREKRSSGALRDVAVVMGRILMRGLKKAILELDRMPWDQLHSILDGLALGQKG